MKISFTMEIDDDTLDVNSCKVFISKELDDREKQQLPNKIMNYFIDKWTIDGFWTIEREK